MAELGLKYGLKDHILYSVKIRHIKLPNVLKLTFSWLRGKQISGKNSSLSLLSQMIGIILNYVIHGTILRSMGKNSIETIDINCFKSSPESYKKANKDRIGEENTTLDRKRHSEDSQQRCRVLCRLSCGLNLLPYLWRHLCFKVIFLSDFCSSSPTSSSAE